MKNRVYLKTLALMGYLLCSNALTVFAAETDIQPPVTHWFYEQLQEKVELFQYYTYEKKLVFKEAVAREVDDLEKRFKQTVRPNLTRTQNATRRNYEALMDTIEFQIDQAKNRLRDLNGATAFDWQFMRDNMRETLSRLTHSMQVAENNQQN